MKGNLQTTTRHPIQLLIIVFLLWKALVFSIALSSPGPGYDSSTVLLDVSASISSFSQAESATQSSRLLNFVRWDALYFTHIAQYGHVFEQEWAFGIGLSTANSLITKILSLSNSFHSTIVSGLILSHFTHFISVILIWLIAGRLLNPEKKHKSPIPIVAAILHIVSPAGIFLSAPYSESLFASLNLTGALLYLKASDSFTAKSTSRGLSFSCLAGTFFGLATVVRSNGTLSGLIFLFDLINIGFTMLADRSIQGYTIKVMALLLGGGFTGLGMVIPQFFAYQNYCMTSEMRDQRPWCQALIPAIYPFVQSHYWNVGLFKYWTISNLPLFILAAPALLIVCYSSLSVMLAGRQSPSYHAGEIVASFFDVSKALRFAIPQFALAIPAVSRCHGQIITRLASGYPFWYIWLSAQICDEHNKVSKKGIVRWMVLYALIQTGLYASFLPPA